MTRVARYTDALLAAALGIGSFLLLFVNYWFPPEKIFDEVYFARAAEEYLKRMYIYENTHPPLAKLIITFSTWLFGGLAHGDNAAGWRFFDVLAGAIAVVLVFVLAKRILRSSMFAAYAALLFAADGMHYVQSRIATPEGIVVCFSLATLYTFCRYWDAVIDGPARVPALHSWVTRIIEGALTLGFAAAFVLARFHAETAQAKGVAIVVIAAALYAAYGFYRARPVGGWWLLAFAFSAAMLVASKWYGVMAYGVATVVVGYATARAWMAKKPDPFPADLVLASAIGAIGIVYSLCYIPQFVGLSDVAGWAPRAYTLSDVVKMQIDAYNYHAHLVATHPYASLWWTWPLDIRPVLYYAKYGNDTAAMIYSLPNPILLWGGIIGVAFTAYLAWRMRNRGYGLVVLTYLMQWLPWAKSPRLAWEYHFYVDIPLIAICNAIAMKWVWETFKERDPITARSIVIGYLALVIAAFVYFFPILSGIPISSEDLQHHRWLSTWL